MPINKAEAARSQELDNEDTCVNGQAKPIAEPGDRGYISYTESHISHTSPYPSPEYVRIYEEFAPGATKEFIKIVKKEQNGRLMTAFVVSLEELLGTFGSLGISAGILFIAYQIVLTDAPWAAALLTGLSPVIGGIAALITALKKNNAKSGDGTIPKNDT